MEDNFYSKALFSAYNELEELRKQELSLMQRRAQIRLTIKALSPLVFPNNLDIKEMSLPTAMRFIMNWAGRPLTATDFKTKLEDIGFDVGKFDNPLANIMTAMSRLVENDEFDWAEGEGKKKVIPGPELKPEPEPPQIDTDRLKGLMDGLTVTTLDPGTT
jgi:hypothetical protein